MPSFVESYSAPAVGDNLAEGKSWARNKRPFRIVRIGFTGGTDASDDPDGEIEVFYGQEKIANIVNTATGSLCASNPNVFFLPGNKRCSSRDQINIEVKASDGSSTYYLYVDIKEG